MPKYVFEVSAILPADESLGVKQGDQLSRALVTALEGWLKLLGHARVEVNYDEPVEQVTGDWLPPDENGIVRVGPSRPIDL